MAIRTVMVSAVKGWPRNTAAARKGMFRRLAMVALKISSTGSSRSRTTMGIGGAGRPLSFGAIDSAAISGTGMYNRFAIHVP